MTGQKPIQVLLPDSPKIIRLSAARRLRILPCSFSSHFQWKIPANFLWFLHPSDLTADHKPGSNWQAADRYCIDIF